MLENPTKRKLVKLLEITNISANKVEKLNYKEKQKYFKAKKISEYIDFSWPRRWYFVKRS